MLTAWNCDVIVLTPKGMQLTQKHAFWRITRQNRSNGLTPSGAKEQTQIQKKAQTINISPLRGDHAPEPIDMPFSVLTPVTDVIIPAKCYVDPLKGFWEGAPPKVPFPILSGTTVTTVLHYRADCDANFFVIYLFTKYRYWYRYRDNFQISYRYRIEIEKVISTHL